MSTVLVTGGAGFVGSHVTAELVARGHAVVVLDSHLDQGRLDPTLPGVERVQGSVLDAPLLAALAARCDRIVHLGAIAGVHHYLERPVDVLDVNLLGTRTVLLTAHARGIPVLIASTSEAYGKNPATLREDGDTWLGPTTNARWCYAVSKLAGEHYAWGLAAQGLTVAATRYFNVYGPTLDAPGTGRVLSQFLGALQRGEPLRLVDGGHAVRCFCWVDDAVRATVDLALALEPGSAVSGRVFNIGNPEPVTMRRLAEIVVALADHAPGVEDVPGEVFFGHGFEDIPHRVPDVGAIAEALGVRPRVDLVEGVRRTLAHWGMLSPTPRALPRDPVPVVRPYYDADARLLDRFRGSLERGWTTNAGPQVQALEAECEAWLGVDRVVSVASGAAGLELALRALGRQGKAILPSFTYIATLNAVELAGLEPVFCDIDPSTWTMSTDHLARLLATHDDVAVVLPVCVYGVPPDLEGVAALTAPRGIDVVYDAAHALGTTTHGRRDTLATVTVYSLHATKLIPAIEGGLVVCADAALADAVAVRRAHGLTPDPLDAVVGQNAKLDELSAATARHALAHADEILARRAAYAGRLDEALRTAGFTLQHVPGGVVPNRVNHCARAPIDLATAGAVLDGHGVGWRRYFHPPLHLLRRVAPQPALPVTEAVHADLMCLPLHSRMTEATLARLEAAYADVGRTR
ncbi:MAG: DegT/DnrJ/EryC1/StrS family aminotransferase [Alphaproteobacteria bacterium]|nr:DegT/DnrJ/EryC1/StrS family aminotransferase [Alphaproteobacteria bacterium]